MDLQISESTTIFSISISEKCAVTSTKLLRKSSGDAYGTAEIVVLERKVNDTVYLRILKGTVISEGNRLIGKTCIYRRDNAPVHTSRIVVDYLVKKIITALKTQIEYTWAMLKIRIAGPLFKI